MDHDRERIDALEMRLAEQDRTIDDLNSAVTQQWTAIEALKRDLERLAGRMADAESRLPGEPDRPPPHY